MAKASSYLSLLLTLFVLCVGSAYASKKLQRARPVLRINRIDSSKPPRIQVYLTDLDSSGSPITDRGAKNYRLLVDGVPQITGHSVETFAKIAEPVAVTLVFQISPSVRDILTDSVDSAKRFIGGLAPNSQVGLIAYSDVVVTNLKPTDVSKAKAAIDNLRIRDEAVEVNLTDALRDALEGLTNKDLPASKMVIVISDGITVDINLMIFSELGRRAQDKGITAHSIGFAPIEPVRLRTLYEFSKRGRGTFREAKDSKEITTAFIALQEEINNQLVVTYKIPKFFDGMVHDLGVETPGGQDSNTVSLSLKKIAPQAKETPFYNSIWFLIALGVIGQMVLALVIWLIVRSRRKARQAALAAQHTEYDEDDEDDDEYDDDEDDEDDEDEYDDDQRRRRRRVEGDDDEYDDDEYDDEDEDDDDGGRPKWSLAMGKEAQQNIDNMFSDKDARSSHGLPQSLTPEAPQSTTPTDPPFTPSSGRLPSSQVGASPNPQSELSASPPGPSPRSRPPSQPMTPGVPSQPITPGAGSQPAHDQGPSLPIATQPPISSKSSGPVPAGGGFRLPLPDPNEFVKHGKSPGAPSSGGLSLPDPNDFMKRAGGGDPSSGQAPAISGVSRAPGQVSPPGASEMAGQPGSVSAAGVRALGMPITDKPRAADSTAQPGKFVDRQTSVMPLEDLNTADYLAWIVDLRNLQQPMILKDRTTLGSAPGCDIQVNGMGVQPNHASITINEQGVQLETAHGQGLEPLFDGSHFYIGDREFVFKVASRNKPTPEGTARLDVLDGMDQGRSIPLQEGEVYTIGCHNSCDLIVRGDKVSKRHALALLQGRSCIISDLGSEAGVWHQGEQVGFKKLHVGDEITLGNIRLIHTIEDDDLPQGR